MSRRVNVVIIRSKMSHQLFVYLHAKQKPFGYSPVVKAVEIEQF